MKKKFFIMVDLIILRQFHIDLTKNYNIVLKE